VLVLQDSVATKLRCSGKVYLQLIPKGFLVMTLKELLKSANIYQYYRKNKSGTVFLTQTVYIQLMIISNHQTGSLLYWIIL